MLNVTDIKLSWFTQQIISAVGMRSAGNHNKQACNGMW